MIYRHKFAANYDILFDFLLQIFIQMMQCIKKALYLQ